MNNGIDSIIEEIKKMPGITNKQAKKIVYFLLNQSKEFRNEYFKKLNEKLNEISKCEICSNYTTKKLCNICLSSDRNKKLIIVENIDQISLFEDWQIFNSKYFIVPLLFNSKFEEIKNYNFDFLLNYLKKFEEVILALSPTAHGLLTMDLISEQIRKENQNIKITQLATGIPIGSSIEYMDKLTMKYAIKNRKEFK